MTKMATTSMYGKKPKLKIFSGTKRPMYVAMSSTKVDKIEDPMLTMPYFMAMSNLIPYSFIWKNVERLIFQELMKQKIIILARYIKHTLTMVINKYKRPTLTFKSDLWTNINMFIHIFLKDCWLY